MKQLHTAFDGDETVFQLISHQVQRKTAQMRAVVRSSEHAKSAAAHFC